MSISARRSLSGPGRPVAVDATAGVLAFLGVSAVAGGVSMVTGVGAMRPPDSWLDGIPLVDSWLIPGLVIGAGFGVGSLITAYGVWRRPRWGWLRPVELVVGYHWSWLATLLAGLALVVWIVLELAYLPQVSVLQGIYGAIGLALLLLPSHPAVRRYLALGD